MARWTIDFNLRVDLTDEELLRLALKAEAISQVTRGIPISPFRREVLHRLNILRAVRGTTGIEGSDLTEEEVGVVLQSKGTGQVLPRARAREEREVRNARDVFDFVAARLTADPHAPVTEDLIREIHRLTTEGIGYQHTTPGQYRSHGVTADTYSAPPHDEVPQLMKRFVEWVNTGPVTHWPVVVRAVAAHFFLISIHPFGDGNGRTARAVESFLLYQGDINTCGFYSLSNFYYRRRAEYIAMLDHVRFESNQDLTPFLRFAAGGLVEELDAVRDLIAQDATIVAFRDFARETLQHAGRLSTKAGERMFLLTASLTAEILSLRELREGSRPPATIYRGVSRQTIQRDLEFLEQQGLIVRVGDGIRANVEVMEPYKFPSRGE